jgi:hypothetical protein
LRSLLALFCGVLVAIIAVELSYGTSREEAIRQKTAYRARIVPEAKESDAPAASAVDQWVAAVLVRPLFTPGRKPTASGEAGLPRLTGVIASPIDGVAIFQGNGNAKPVMARRGDTVAGWQVITIAGDTVGLRKGSAQLAIRPEFDNLKRAAQAVTQPRPRWEAVAETGILRARWSNPQLQP